MPNGKHKKLYYFTFSYPYGKGENWKAQELEYFASRFGEITVVPYNYDGNDQPRALPDGVKCTKPLFKNLGYRVTMSFILSLLNKQIFYYLREFITEHVYSQKAWLINWMNATAFSQKLQSHEVINQIIRESDRNSVFYFFWGIYHTSIIPLLPKNKIGKIVVRFHGGDLYKERSGGYIAYRRQLLNRIDIAVPISEMGANYLRDNYNTDNFQISVSRIGVNSQGKSTPSDDGVLRLLSCSTLIPLKRVDMIATALRYLPFQVKWIHLGDGEMTEQIKELISNLPENIDVELKGWVQPDKVLPFYSNGSFDLFINVSTTEGVPVSVMEAFAAAIPVLATDVGGTSEIVDEDVGELLPSQIEAEGLAERIRAFQELDQTQRIKKGKNAYDRYLKKCDANKLAMEMCDLLSSQETQHND